MNHAYLETLQVALGHVATSRSSLIHRMLSPYECFRAYDHIKDVRRGVWR